MNLLKKKDKPAYRTAMRQLLVLYTQIDRLIMEALTVPYLEHKIRIYRVFPGNQ